MGTRGAVGFRFQGVDKLTYNHFDSYPTGLGVDVVEIVRKFNDEQLAGAANRLVLIDEVARPTAAEIKRYRRFANTGVSTGKVTEWYVLLREAQGRLDLYVDGSIDHMPDGVAFMGNSLFCEWAYVINMDERVLEVYKGFNQNAAAPGRYAATEVSGDGYAGVALLAAIPLDDVRSWTDVMAAMVKLEEEG